MSTIYKNGDLVWAKMKGFPPWPAEITLCPKLLQDGTVGNGKYTVFFFGTKEIAQMKAIELFPYLKHRHEFEKERKLKSFNDALNEIRCAANITEEFKPEVEKIVLSENCFIEETRSGRIRKPSSKISSSDFIMPFSKTRTTSKSIDLSPTNNKSIAQNLSKQSTFKPAFQNKKNRYRNDSNCSNYSNGSVSKRLKRVSYSDKLGLDFGLDYDPLLTSEADPVFLNACLDSNSITAYDEEEEKPRRSRRRTRSRIFDDLLISPGKCQFRDRSRSISSNNGSRSRLASGYSDAFDELIESAQSIFNPSELMAAIEQLPSEDSDRPLTPEEPVTILTQFKKCYACHYQCELSNLKWRCTNLSCMKWNGSYNLHSNLQCDTDQLNKKTSEQVELEEAIKAIKEEANAFEEEYNQQKKCQQQQSPLQQEKNLQNFSTLFQSESIKEEKEQLNNGNNFSLTNHKSQKIKLNQNPMQFAPLSNYNYPFTTQNPIAINEKTKATNNLRNIRLTTEMNNLGNILRKKCGRPKSYKVEKTPPMGPDGLRLCVFCNGQVRPQMCGGNKHRWRCVDKKCRKWYGWVLSCDEIPLDLGKKGRWKDFAANSRQTENQANNRRNIELSGDQIATDLLLNNETLELNAMPLKQQRRIGRPPKIFIEDDPNLDKIRTKFPAHNSDGRFRKKYIKKKRIDEFELKRPISPLTLRQMSYDPSAIERHSRWWLQPRRRTDLSPERDLPASVLNNAATFRVISNAMFTAASTKTDEPGTINGSLDLLLDTLTSSMAPLLSLFNKIPTVMQTNEHSETIRKLWKASSVHTPTF